MKNAFTIIYVTPILNITYACNIFLRTKIDFQLYRITEIARPTVSLILATSMNFK